MKAHPILFSGEMIKAILDGRKTQTRRVIKSIAPEWELNPIMERVYMGVFEWDKHPWPWRMTNPKQKYDGRFGVFVQYQTDVDDYATTFIPCPYGAAGDRLRVQEGYQITGSPIGTRRVQGRYMQGDTPFDVDLSSAEYTKWERRKWPFRATSGRFMYRSLSRIALENERVWVERVQDISKQDALAEGMTKRNDLVAKFAQLWDAINAKRGYGWDVNPWVWCIEFSNSDRRHK